MAAQKGYTKLCLFLIQEHNAFVDVVTLVSVICLRSFDKLSEPRFSNEVDTHLEKTNPTPLGCQKRTARSLQSAVGAESESRRF